MVGYKARKISMFPDSPAQLENVNENRKIPFSKVAKTWITQEYTLTKNGDILWDEDSIRYLKEIWIDGKTGTLSIGRRLILRKLI